MGAPHERAGRVGHLEPGLLPRLAALVGGPVGGDEDPAGRSALEALEPALVNAPGGERFEHERIVDELAEDRQRTFRREVFGLPECVAHAEAEAVVFREDDFHKRLCMAKLQTKVFQPCPVLMMRSSSVR